MLGFLFFSAPQFIWQNAVEHMLHCFSVLWTKEEVATVPA